MCSKWRRVKRDKAKLSLLATYGSKSQTPVASGLQNLCDTVKSLAAPKFRTHGYTDFWLTVLQAFVVDAHEEANTHLIGVCQLVGLLEVKW